MAVVVVGLSHHTAPVEVRERFVFNEAEAAALVLQLAAEGVAREAVVLSTCNRTELYAVGGGDDVASGEVDGNAVVQALIGAAESKLAERAGLPVTQVRRYLYHHVDQGAARHLFRVVASLDAMVVGEAQIQGQVKAAYEHAASLGGERRVAGPILTRLFESALRVGGRVRGETSLGVGAASVPGAAIHLARKIFGPLRGRRALVLGAGEMSELAIECLASEGVESVVVANRTDARAEALAERVGGRAARYAELPGLLPEAEIITTATAAPHAVITRELMERAFPGGSSHPLLIVDIALPRDVEPAVAELENVFLYDIDDLHQIVDDNLERRREAIPVAERIVVEETGNFWSWYGSLEVVPVIRALRDRAEELRQVEVSKALKRLEHLSPEDRDAVDVLTRQLLNKVLHPPTVRLREAASNGHGVAVVDTARYLFGLDGVGGAEAE